jgi:hypothetical protein
MARPSKIVEPNYEQARTRKKKGEFRTREWANPFDTQRGETIGDKSPERSDRECDQIPETTTHQRRYPEGIKE